MSIQTAKYDGEHYQVMVVNMRDGSVQVHGVGCADLKRSKAKFADDPTLWDCKDTADVWASYNSDFLAEGGETNAYDLHWLPCANHVPAGDNHAKYVEWFGDDAVPVAYQTEVVTHEPVITTKVGRKWTYIYSDGDLVAEVRNDSVAAVLGALR